MQAEIVERLSMELLDEDQSIKESASPSVSQSGHSAYGAGLSFGVSVRLNKLKTLSGQRNTLYLRKMD